MSAPGGRDARAAAGVAATWPQPARAISTQRARGVLGRGGPSPGCARSARSRPASAPPRRAARRPGSATRRDRAGQRRAADHREVEARRLERVCLREQLVRHDHRDQAREAAERQRPGDPAPRAPPAAPSSWARCPPAARSPTRSMARQHLVQDHRRRRRLRLRSSHAPSSGPDTMLGSVTAATVSARQRRAAGAVEDEQHDADREHLVGEAGDRRGRLEERVAGLAAQLRRESGHDG